MTRFYLINFLITFISEAIKDFEKKQVTDQKQRAGMRGEKEIKVYGQIQLVSPTTSLLLIQVKMFPVISALLTSLLIDPTIKD